MKDSKKEKLLGKNHLTNENKIHIYENIIMNNINYFNKTRLLNKLFNDLFLN